MEEWNPKEVLKRIQQKGATTKCERCRNNIWELQEVGFVNLMLQQDKGVQIGGPSLPSAVVVCKVCGNTVLHNLAVLGLDPIGE